MTGHNTASALRALLAQIEEVCNHFKEIRSEASGIVATNAMPDAALHLNDVLESTETATTAILDAATAISYVAEGDGVPEDARTKIAEQVGRIYEAASFQDISGQRIKKVLAHLTQLEAQLQRLSETARSQVAVPKPKDSLLNGPQLAAETPTQDEVDKLFGSMK